MRSSVYIYFFTSEKTKNGRKTKVNNKLRCQWIDNFLPTKSTVERYGLMWEALVHEANWWKQARRYWHPSMHHLGPGLLQRPLNVDLSKRSGPECYYLPSKSSDCCEQKQTPRDSCSVAVSRHSEDKIGRSHSEGQEHPSFPGHKIWTWKLIARVS